MQSDPETAELLAANSTQAFLGPGAALICYPISQGRLFNLAIMASSDSYHASKERAGVWNEPVQMHAFRAMFKDFSPVARRLIALADRVAGWTIAEVKQLPNWSSSSGKVVLLGDAAQ